MTKSDRLGALNKVLGGCRACELCTGRTKVVYGEGSPDAPIMFVGEGPGKEEDAAGRPFVGRCGQLLRKMIMAIGLNPETDCFIANVVKCRPPANRTPTTEETGICSKFLKKQIEIIKPKQLVLLGRTAAVALAPESSLPIKLLRLEEHIYDGIPIKVTYHPSALLRDPTRKPLASEDFKYLQTLIPSLYGDGRYGPSSGNESSEQLSVEERDGVHGGEGGGSKDKAYRLPSLFSEDENISA